MKMVIPDETAMEQLGAQLAAACVAPAVIYLHGDLGAGKTTLVRGYLKSLDYPGPVRSPTYTLVEPYDTSAGRIFHLDLYRLADPEELEYLGVRDIQAEQGIMLVEWPEQGSGWLPAADLVVSIAHRADGRDVELAANSEQGARLLSEWATPVSG